jgi:hypothetical protein
LSEAIVSLKQWEANGWLKPHKTSPNEIGNLLAIVSRDLEDAKGGVSPDWRFAIAYNAALKLCTVLLYAEGYRPSHGAHHFRSILAMPLILGPTSQPDADYLDACRNKRNAVEYDYVGAATEEEAEELRAFVDEFKEAVHRWLVERHPGLLSETP